MRQSEIGGNARKKPSFDYANWRLLQICKKWRFLKKQQKIYL